MTNWLASGLPRSDLGQDMVNPLLSVVIPAGSEKERNVANAIPVKRVGEVGDVARAVAFFADPANSFVTGQVLYVCGGSSVGSLAL